MTIINNGRGNPRFTGIFGETSAESWQTDISMNFVYGLPCANKFKDLSTGGTVTVEGNLLHVDNALGVGHFRTTDRVRYRNGHSLAARFTTILSAQPTEVRSIVINNNTVIESVILDVENVDFTKAQIYQEAYGYLGFAPIQTDIFQDFGFTPESIMRFHNRATSTHVSTPYSAFSVKVEEGLITVGLFEADSGVAIQFVMPTGVQHCRIGSIFAGVMAGNLSPSNIYNHHRSRKTALTAAAQAGTTWRNIVTYKSLDTYKGVDNKIIAALSSFNYLLFGLATGEEDFYVCIAKNATPATPFSFTQVNDCSTIQYDATSPDLTIAEADILYSTPGFAVAGQGSRPGQFTTSTEDAVRDGITIVPGEGTISIAVKCQVAFSFSSSLQWRELF